jgi:hypothetical protein
VARFGVVIPTLRRETAALRGRRIGSRLLLSRRQEPFVHPFPSTVARFLAWAVSWPITVGILAWWWLAVDRPA